MKRQDLFENGSLPDDRSIGTLAPFAIAGALLLGAAAYAQTRSPHDAATAYGARLNAKGELAELNPNRVNNRVDSRLQTRLSLRVERYRPARTADPAAAFAARSTDNARVGTETTLLPLSTSDLRTHDALSSQTSSEQTDDGTRPH